MEDWGVLNAVPEPPPEEIDLAPRSRPRQPEPPSNSLLPDPDMLVDVPIKSHRSYAGFIFLLVIAAGAAGLYFVMKTDLSSDRVRGNPEGIQLGTPQSITKAGAAPEDVEIAPPPKKTLLRLESDPPGARVVVNGNPASAVTPTAVQTFVGQPVRVHMFLDGHAPVMKSLTVAGGEETVKVALEAVKKAETGKLEVTSDPPGAFITYNGVVVGETPFTLEALPAGHPFFFRLQKEGHEPHTVRYEVAAGAERRMGVRMVPVDPDNERTMATVTVESDPLVANIDRVAGGKNDREGTTGSRPVQVFARIGYPLVLEASARGHGTDQAAIDVVDPNYTVLMKLPPPKKTFGNLKLTGPKNLTVYIDAEEQDPLPIEKKQMSSGEHDIVVVEPQTKTKAKLKVRIEEEQTVTKAIRLTDDGRIVIE